MIVYHGSICEIREPDVTRAKGRLDFGRAFYVTTYKRQAEKWALRKAVRSLGTPIVNVYELAEYQLAKFNVKEFGSSDGEWLDFVCACRAGKGIYRAYDIVKGRVANDDVFKTVDAYLHGNMTREAAIRDLSYAKPNDQIAVTKAKAIRSLLTFIRSYVVGQQKDD